MIIIQAHMQPNPISEILVLNMVTSTIVGGIRISTSAIADPMICEQLPNIITPSEKLKNLIFWKNESSSHGVVKSSSVSLI